MGELNKIVAGLCSSLLVLLGLNFFGEQIFHPHSEKGELAFALEIEGGDAGDATEEVTIDLAALFSLADAAKGEKVYKKCKSCHALEQGKNGTGPYLWGVVNREIGSAEGFGKYSGNLPAGEAWTGTNLFEFLAAPADWSKEKTGGKTSMSFKGLKKPEDRANLIAYLNQIDGSPDTLE